MGGTILMRLFEYEGKTLFRKAGIRVPEAFVVEEMDDLNGYDDDVWPKMVKAQTLRGGRGKAGGIVTVTTMKELKTAVRSLLGKSLREEDVKSVLVEQKLRVRKEYYLSMTYKNDLPAIIFSRHGGIEVEELSRKKPAAVVLEQIDIMNGFDSKQAHKVLAKASVREDIEELTDVMLKLYKCFCSNDALIAEINPLVLT